VLFSFYAFLVTYGIGLAFVHCNWYNF